MSWIILMLPQRNSMLLSHFLLFIPCHSRVTKVFNLVLYSFMASLYGSLPNSTGRHCVLSSPTQIFLTLNNLKLGKASPQPLSLALGLNFRAKNIFTSLQAQSRLHSGREGYPSGKPHPASRDKSHLAWRSGFSPGSQVFICSQFMR